MFAEPIVFRVPILLSVLLWTGVALAGNRTTRVAELIGAEIPNYDQMSSFERIDAIRHWVFATVDLAGDNTQLIDENKYPLTEFTVDQNFERVLQDKGGYWCGGAAYLGAQAFEAMGFHAVTYDMGNPNLMSHVTVLVEVEGKYYDEDVYLDLTYMDSHGQHLPLDSVLTGLARGKVQPVRFGPTVEKDVHLSQPVGDFGADSAWELGVESPRFKEKLASNHFVYRCAVTFERFDKGMRQDCPQLYAWIKKEGWPDNLQFLMLYPLGLNEDGVFYRPGSDQPLLKHIEQLVHDQRVPGH